MLGNYLSSSSSIISSDSPSIILSDFRSPNLFILLLLLSCLLDAFTFASLKNAYKDRTAKSPNTIEFNVLPASHFGQ